MKLRCLRPDFYIHVSVSNLYVPTFDLPIRPQENRWIDWIMGICKSLTDT
jgi:hypothetical protein